MQQTPKKPDAEKEKPPLKDGEWEHDQTERPYYYDDAHGYEAYSETDEDENSEEDEQPSHSA